ncbi:hypothetical protein ILYODFUR_028634 [Ilyodon furcidens]|uniref:60S ribosomal protein L29 n=1 Tax=Ilyodon furcidens TaxID=33524 RepID=A0ABV0V6W6_9TELE
MFLDCGRKPEYPGGEPTHAHGEHANSMQKDPRPGVKPRTFLLQGNCSHCTVAQLVALYLQLAIYLSGNKYERKNGWEKNINKTHLSKRIKANRENYNYKMRRAQRQIIKAKD